MTVKAYVPSLVTLFINGFYIFFGKIANITAGFDHPGNPSLCRQGDDVY